MKAHRFLNCSLWLQVRIKCARRRLCWRICLRRAASAVRPGMRSRRLATGAIVRRWLRLPGARGASVRRRSPSRAPSRPGASAFRALWPVVGCGTAGSRVHGLRRPGPCQDTVAAACEQRCVGSRSRGTAGCCYYLSMASKRHASMKSQLGSDSQRSRAQEE